MTYSGKNLSINEERLTRLFNFRVGNCGQLLEISNLTILSRSITRSEYVLQACFETHRTDLPEMRSERLNYSTRTRAVFNRFARENVCRTATITYLISSFNLEGKTELIYRWPK